MRHRIDMVPLGPQTYAAFVFDGTSTTLHRVVLTPEFLTGTGLGCADEEAVAHQALFCLLERYPDEPLPEVLELTSTSVADREMVFGLRARLV